MKPKLLGVAAALAACGAFSIAFAQTPKDAPEKPTGGPAFVSEPVASATTVQGPEGERLKAIADALNAEASLKDAKITVQNDGDHVLLTGAAKNQEQVKRASEIATSSANGATVVNVVQPDHVAKYGVQPQPIEAPEPQEPAQRES